MLIAKNLAPIAGRTIMQTGLLLRRDAEDPKTRIYATSLAQPYHVDRAADIVGLLCLQTAKEGGAFPSP